MKHAGARAWCLIGPWTAGSKDDWLRWIQRGWLKRRVWHVSERVVVGFGDPPGLKGLLTWGWIWRSTRTKRVVNLELNLTIERG